jgi:hypothetical protein
MHRITSGWTALRVIYLLMGLLMAVYSATTATWVGLVIGLYFASMGLFGFGCAAGNCAIPHQATKPLEQETTGNKHGNI